MKTRKTDKIRDCDLCGTNNGKVYYDDQMRNQSSWANMCEPCWYKNGVGIGTRVEIRTTVKKATTKSVAAIDLV